MENRGSFGGRSLLVDPVVILQDVIRNWFLVVVLSLAIGVTVFILTDMRYTPVYESSATLVVTTHTSFSSVYDNIDSASKLASVFSEILNSTVMKKRIAEVLEIPEFTGTIYASGVEGTNLLVLKVRVADSRTAFLTVKALIENHHIVTYDVIGDIAVEVLEYPMVPKAPVNVSNVWGAMKRAVILAAAAISAILAVLSARRNVIRSREEAEKKLKCWCLGEICHERKNKSVFDILGKRKTSILVSKPETSFEYVASLSKISRRIRKHMHRGNVLAVTSVAENEGKTTVSANLALSFAKQYRNVLLIDCDLRKPACHSILEMKHPKFCINDVAEGKVPLREAIVTDRLSGLQVLCARKTANTSADLIFDTIGMKKLFKQVRDEFDVVVVDLPPMSVCADSEYVAEYADASLLVVRQNSVGVPELNHAVSVLENTHARMLGCVVNNVHTSFLTSGEGCATGYSRRSYGYGGKYGKNRYYSTYSSKDTL